MAPKSKKAAPAKAAPPALKKQTTAAPPAVAPPAKKRARFEGAPTPSPAAKKAKKAAAIARSKGKSVEKELPKPQPKPKAKSYSKSEPKPVKIVRTPPAPRTFIVAAGSYERLLYGISCSLEESAPSGAGGLPYQLVVNPIFSFPAHLSSIRSVSASILPSPGTGSERKVGGKYLVSGGTDEVIKVWDLRRKKEVGSLEGEAGGTITCLRFVAQRNMLLAASTDSAITLYRVRDWVLLRSLKGHKGRVNSIDAHPAGRVALSVGQDKMLRMWDLVAGKAVATLKIGEEGDVVRWNTDGTKFATICASTLTVYGIDMAIHHTFTARSRFHDVRFCFYPLDAEDPNQKEYMFVACEDGKTRVFDVTTSKAAATEKQKSNLEGEEEAGTPLEAFAQLGEHANRVKMMDLLEVALPTGTASTIILSTISSDGKINLYDLASLALVERKAGQVADIKPQASYDTDGSRLTCVCAIGSVEDTAGKDGEGAEEEDSEEDSEEEDNDDDEEEEEDVDGEDKEEDEGEMEDEEEQEEE